MIVDIETKMITLLGTPLKQSFAARMQNLAYEAAGLNMLYFYTETDTRHLGEIVNALRYMNFAGFAVTKPNKVEVLKYLDELSPLCEKMGACNTVVRTPKGKLIGYNTDGMGFYRSITQEAGIAIPSRRFFLFGAGGAGRAIASVLAWKGAKEILITDVFPEAAQSLAEDINRNFAPVAKTAKPEDSRACDFIINASGIGMGATVGQSPLPEEAFTDRAFYFDACYNPERTQFLLNAEKAGARVMNGLGMSLWQGVQQVELWTGKPFDGKIMNQALKRAMEEQGYL